ncbi:MAG: hypothetical protein AAB779_04465, partial [Patescibacteria group bacterium]
QRIDRLDDLTLINPALSGGSITGTSVSATSLAVTGTGTSTFSGGIQATALNLTSTSASSTFANGLVVSGGCVLVNGSCLGSAAVAGGDTQVQFNNAGSLGANSNFTFSSSTSLFKVTNASTTNFSNFGIAYFGATATSSFSSTGALTLATPLAVSSGGTGSTTLTGLLKGNGTGGILSAISGTDYVLGVTGDWTGTFDGQEGTFYLANSFSTTSADSWIIASSTIPKTTLAINWGALQTFTSGFISNASSTITSGLFSMNGGASTTQLSISGASWLGTPSALVGTNITGTGASFTAGSATVLATARNINGTSFNGSADITITSASSTLLSNNNTFSGLNIFGNASTTLLSLFDKLYVGNTSGTAATTTLQGNTTGTSTIQGILNVAGANSTSTFSGGLTS